MQEKTIQHNKYWKYLHQIMNQILYMKGIRIQKTMTFNKHCFLFFPRKIDLLILDRCWSGEFRDALLKLFLIKHVYYSMRSVYCFCTTMAVYTRDKTIRLIIYHLHECMISLGTDLQLWFCINFIAINPDHQSHDLLNFENTTIKSFIML